MLLKSLCDSWRDRKKKINLFLIRCAISKHRVLSTSSVGTGKLSGAALHHKRKPIRTLLSSFSNLKRARNTSTTSWNTSECLHFASALWFNSSRAILRVSSCHPLELGFRWAKDISILQNSTSRLEAEAENNFHGTQVPIHTLQLCYLASQIYLFSMKM